MNYIQLDEEKTDAFKNAVTAMDDFRRIFKRDLEPSFIAELYVAEKLNLKINLSSTEPGFDAIDSSGSRFEIKYRSITTQNVDVNNFDFDYLILVNLDNLYRLIEMWKMSSDQARQIFTQRKDFRKYQVTQKKFKSIGKRLF